MKFKGGTDKERLALAAHKNSFYDSEPTKTVFGYTKESLMKLRERSPDKELGPPSFRFKARNYLEKLKDTINNRNATVTYTNRELYHNDLKDKKGNLKSNLVGIVPKMKKVFYKKRKT